MAIECVKVVVVCRDCSKTNQFSLHPADADDWGWMILDEIRK